MKTLLAHFGLRPSDISFEVYTGKVAESGQRIVRGAYRQARALKHSQLVPEHALIAYAKIESLKFESLLHKLNRDPEVALHAISEGLGQGSHAGDALKVSEEFRATLAAALEHARQNGRGRIEAEDVLIGIFANARSDSVTLFEQLGVNHETITQQIHEIDANR
ncbi:MAG: Clp protease N-terminal domain-containing protein [Blastocatellia bacterium]